ncbi:hypothetical protein D3C80_1873450 [compost metagenome]
MKFVCGSGLHRLIRSIIRLLQEATPIGHTRSYPVLMLPVSSTQSVKASPVGRQVTELSATVIYLSREDLQSIWLQQLIRLPPFRKVCRSNRQRLFLARD